MCVALFTVYKFLILYSVNCTCSRADRIEIEGSWQRPPLHLLLSPSKVCVISWKITGYKFGDDIHLQVPLPHCSITYAAAFVPQYARIQKYLGIINT